MGSMWGTSGGHHGLGRGRCMAGPGRSNTWYFVEQWAGQGRAAAMASSIDATFAVHCCLHARRLATGCDTHVCVTEMDDK